MSESRRLILAVSLQFTGLFAVLGVSLPFVPVWLASRGLSAAEIGLALGAGLLVRLVVSPLAGRWADRYGRREVSMGLAALGVAASLAYPLIHEVIAAGLLVGLVTGVWTAGNAVTDATAMDAERLGVAHYSRLRAAGSATFLAVSLGFGAALPSLGIDALIPAQIAAFVLTFVAAAATPRPRDPAAAPQRGKAGRSLARVLADPVLLACMAAMALIQNSHHFLYGFASIHWRSVGHSEAWIGWFWAEGVLVEIALFLFAPRLAERFGARALMIAAGLAAALRWVAIALSPDLVTMLALQGLHGVSFGCAMLGMKTILTERVPPTALGGVLGLFVAVPMGIGGALVSTLAGALYHRWGGDAFLVGAAMAALGVVPALWMSGRAQDIPAPSPEP